jgi:mono/diheme cytochrome c family protein
MFVGLASAAALSVVAGFGVQSSTAAPPPTKSETAQPAASSATKPAAVKPGAGDAHADERLATVTAFLNKHCVSCHGPTKKKADLVLHTLGDQPALVKGRKTVQHSVKMVKAREMPPENKPQPTVEEVEAFTEALNGIYADADKNAKPDPGRVTVRG